MNKKFIFLSIGIALLVVAAITLSSYAYFTISNKEGEESVITSGTMSLLFTDGNEISAIDMLPGDYIEKEFSVTNTGNLDTVYDVYFSEMVNTFVDKTDLVYEITSLDGGFNTTNQIEVPNKSEKIISNQSINVGETHHYKLKITFLNKDENQDDNQGKEFWAKIQINEYKNNEHLYPVFDYIENEEQEFVIKKAGIYNLEVWGAQGGSYSTSIGGYGAYSTGNIYLAENTKLYINVGGNGRCVSGYSGKISGGYNGGGEAYSSRGSGFNSCAGGGATSITLESGLLSTFANKIDKVIIVAGAGGGATYRTSEKGSYFNGAAGGGIQGNTTSGSAGWSIRNSTGGTQTDGGYGGALNNDPGASYGGFGYGGRYAFGTQLSGGGSGYYGGGSGNDTGGGGGSGYIASSQLISSNGITKHMTCYNCSVSDAIETKTETNVCHSQTATPDCAKEGNGYAKIAYLGA